jgi:predicted DNA-binding transcriptional regulator AlpA
MTTTPETHAPSADHDRDPLTYSADQLAEALGVSERHVWSMHSTGRLGPRPLAFGRAKRWVAAEIRAWLSAGGPSRDKWLAIRERQLTDGQ